MSQLAIIGGTGLTNITGLDIVQQHQLKTPFGEPSAKIVEAKLGDRMVFFIARHGEQHTIAPHRINYRANIWALESLGVTEVIAVAAVGGISADAKPETIVCPDQIIDYTYGREQSFFSDNFSAHHHIDFTHPYSEELRQRILSAGQQINIQIVNKGVYGATQGPRLETTAEIKRMARDGCTLVGMTGMPEAALARELGLDYACCALVVNWAAGLSGQEIHYSEIEQTVISGMASVQQVVIAMIEQTSAN
jgi:5'-deoxy-5'-methylthioadenosine phosphorylase